MRHELVDRAVRDVNRIYQQRGIEFVRQLGTYLLQRFFRNNSEAFRRDGQRHMSFRALAQHPDLDVSPTTLYRAVSIELQIRRLPVEFASSLSVSHHRILLTVPDLQKKISFAQVAASRRMSTREFRAYVRDSMTRHKLPTRRGRPRVPALIKGLQSLNRAIDTATAAPLEVARFRESDRDRARGLLQELDGKLSVLQELCARAQRVLEAPHD